MNKLIHAVEVIGWATVAAGVSAGAEAFATGQPADITSKTWWLHTGITVGTAAIVAARKALAHQLDPDPDPS